MTATETLNQQIEEKKQRLANVKGTETEVYTRIVGYYRPMKNFNAGQDAQRKRRKYYRLK